MFRIEPRLNNDPLTKAQLMDTPAQKMLTQGNPWVLPHRNTAWRRSWSLTCTHSTIFRNKSVYTKTVATKQSIQAWHLYHAQVRYQKHTFKLLSLDKCCLGRGAIVCFAGRSNHQLHRSSSSAVPFQRNMRTTIVSSISYVPG